MVCCLTAPSHYLNQCWLIISKVLWHSSEDIIIRRFEDTNQYSKIEDYIFKITLRSPRGQWVKNKAKHNKTVSIYDWGILKAHRNRTLGLVRHDNVDIILNIEWGGQVWVSGVRGPIERHSMKLWYLLYLMLEIPQFRPILAWYYMHFHCVILQRIYTLRGKCWLFSAIHISMA